MKEKEVKTLVCKYKDCLKGEKCPYLHSEQEVQNFLKGFYSNIIFKKGIKLNGRPIDEECPICCEEFVEHQRLRRLNCEHWFHRDCLSNWIKTSQTCPMCRAILEIKEKKKPTTHD